METMRDIRQMTFAEAMENLFQGWPQRKTSVAILVDSMHLAGKKVTPALVNRISYAVNNIGDLKHNEQVPEYERKGVLLADSRNAYYVDRPFVIFIGLDASWDVTAAGKDYVDKEAEARKTAEEEKATKGASASDRAAPKEKRTGPDLEFTIVAVEHLWESDSVVPDGIVPFHIMGGVTNNTDETVSINGLPSLYCPETGVTADLILYDNNDQTDEVDAIKPGEAMAFDYYEEVDKPYGGWVFRANSDLEVSGLVGVPEQVQGVLQQGFDELAAYKEQEAQRMQEQAQQKAERGHTSIPIR
jgi:hypothetical protein